MLSRSGYVACAIAFLIGFGTLALLLMEETSLVYDFICEFTKTFFTVLSLSFFRLHGVKHIEMSWLIFNSIAACVWKLSRLFG